MPLIFSGTMWTACVENVPGGLLDMHRDRAHLLIAAGGRSAHPTAPRALAQKLRRHRVVSPLDLHMPVPMHAPQRFVEQIKPRWRQRQQRRLLHSGSKTSFTCRRVVPWMRVSATLHLPAQQMMVLIGQGSEGSPFEGVALSHTRCPARSSPCAGACTAWSAGWRSRNARRTTGPWGKAPDRTSRPALTAARRLSMTSVCGTPPKWAKAFSRERRKSSVV